MKAKRKGILFFSLWTILILSAGCEETRVVHREKEEDVLKSYQLENLSAQSFVDILNKYDGRYCSGEDRCGRRASYIERYEDESLRSTRSGEDDWFVIWDATAREYKAVSLQYLRSIVFSSYSGWYNKQYAFGEEFRSIEEEGPAGGNRSDYETVVYNEEYGRFVGEHSNLYYEDRRESRDVNLLAAEAQEKKLYHKVANISYAYEISIESAFSLASLGDKVEGMLKKGADQEELTAEDQRVLMKDLEHFTGVTLEEVIAAGVDSQKKEEVLKKISTKLGTSTQNLEEKILPELLGVR